jgi:hypothetical protein
MILISITTQPGSAADPSEDHAGADPRYVNMSLPKTGSSILREGEGRLKRKPLGFFVLIY